MKNYVWISCAVVYILLYIMYCATTRERLIAALLTAGKYELKMPAVIASRVASPYRQRVYTEDAGDTYIIAGESSM